MTPTYVVDASFVLAFLLPDEKTAHTDDIFARYSRGECKLIAPQLLPFETFNGLESAIVRKRLAHETAMRLARDFLNLRIPLQDTDFEGAFTIARAEKLSVYDAAYIQLARASRAPLLTMDARLRKG